MRQGWWLALLAGLAFSGPALAQNWQFRWQKGQVLTYRTEHSTTVTEVAEGSKVESKSKVDLVKRWQVLDLDAQGVATLQLSLASMRNEQTRPNGETLVFDSADTAKSTPELKEAMAKYIGVPIATLRMDSLGRIIEVKLGQASRFEAEPPFVVIFPGQPPAQGQAWLRPYNVVIEPPHGTGEKFEAVQKYQCDKIEGGKATLTVTTQFKNLPVTAKEQTPLLQKMSEGQIVFDVQAGRLNVVQLVIDRAIQNHHGEGSSYRFQSRFVEQLVDVK